MAAATPMAGAPRTRRLRVASHTSSTVRQSRYSRGSGKSVWSIKRTKPEASPTHSIVRGVLIVIPLLAAEQAEHLVVDAAVAGDDVGAVDGRRVAPVGEAAAGLLHDGLQR